MKKLLFTGFLLGMFFTGINAQYGVEQTGYEGDYFSLEGAIELFKESRSINNFERRLNQEDSWVNNLDLNYDGNIDYIRVEHRNQGDFHAIILQAILGRRDVQDVAVIEIERTGRRTAVLQIIGDADLYGEEVIAEPYNSAGYSDRGDYDFNRGYVNVFHWRAVQRMFDRSYVAYVSPYRWNYYPTYWSPWNQHRWSIYHPRRARYYRNCHIVYVHRVVRVHNFYRPFRVHSRNVAQRARKHRRTHGSLVVHRTHGKKNHTYRASGRSGNNVKVSPRNAHGSRTTASNGRSKIVSPRSTSGTRTSTQNRNIGKSSRNSSQVNRRQTNDAVSSRSARSTRVQSDRRETTRATKPEVRKQQSRTSAQTRTKSVQKSRSAQTGQSRVAKTQKRSQTRTAPARTQQKAQTRSAPRKTQQRTTTSSRKQSSSARTSTPRKSTSAKKSSTPQKSASKRSAPTRTTSKAKSVRKGRG